MKKDKLTKKESDKIIAYCVKHPDKMVYELMDKFNITMNLAFYLVCESAKKLK